MDYRLLEQLLNLPRIQVDDYRQTENEILITISIRYNEHRCPKCKREFATMSEVTEQRVRDLPVFGKTCYLIVRKGRLQCPCSFRGYEEIDFVDKNQRQTKRFDQFLFMMCDRMTLLDFSELMQVNCNRANNLDKRNLHNLKLEKAFTTLSIIGVDEISFEKHHKYFTIVYDLSTKNGVLYVSQGRSQESLDEFFSQLTERQKQSIKAVCMDMWDAYIKSVCNPVLHAKSIWTSLHLKKNLNNCMKKLKL